MKSQWGTDSVIEWTDKKRYFGLPISFTRYSIQSSSEWTKLVIKTGLLFTREDEINLYRITDMSFTSTLFDKIFGVGTLTINSTDTTCPKVQLLRIKNPIEVRNMLATKVEEERLKKGFRIAEVE